MSHLSFYVAQSAERSLNGYSLEEIRRLWHYTNLQPLWRHENDAKGASLDWDLEEYLMELNNGEEKSG